MQQLINLLLLQNKSPLAQSLRSPWGSAERCNTDHVCVCVCESAETKLNTETSRSHWTVLSLFSLQRWTETVSGPFATLPRSPSRVCSSSLEKDDPAALMICKVRGQQRTASCTVLLPQILTTAHNVDSSAAENSSQQMHDFLFY